MAAGGVWPDLSGWTARGALSATYDALAKNPEIRAASGHNPGFHERAA
jgi:hypothetical protein